MKCVYFFQKKRKTAERQTPYYRHRLFCRNRTLSICHLIVWRVAVTAAAVVVVVVHLFSMCSYIYFPIETLATHIECVYVCLCVCVVREHNNIFCVTGWPIDKHRHTMFPFLVHVLFLPRSFARSFAFHVLFICHVLVFRCIWIAHAHDTSANITYTIMWYNVMHIPIIYTLHSTRTLIQFYDVHNCQFCCFQSTRFRWTMETACMYTQLKNTQK